MSDREFGEAITALHLKAGAPSSRAVASRIGQVSHDTVNRTVKGRTIPSWPIAAKIVLALGGDLDEFRALWISAREKASKLGQELNRDDSWISIPAENLAVGNETIVDGGWELITGTGTDSSGHVHVYLGRIELIFVPGSFVIIRAAEEI